jgi:hypothetical protein
MIVNPLNPICNELFTSPVLCTSNVHVVEKTIPVLIYPTKYASPLIVDAQLSTSGSTIVEFAGAIQSTVAVVIPVFPTMSWNVNVKLPFPVNVYVADHELFVIVIALDQLNVAITLLLVIVHDIGLYVIVPIGIVLSIQVTVAIALPVFPAESSNVKVKLPFPVNV